MKKNIIYLLLIIFSTFLNANEKVVLQLKWFHQFQFAGYYAAKEKGFYDEVGLDVEIKQRDLKSNNIDEVFVGSCMTNIGLFRALGEVLKKLCDTILLLHNKHPCGTKDGA
ncbi:hypothetical protein AS859_11535, partial [Aliarcobacter cryaerophilus]